MVPLLLDLRGPLALSALLSLLLDHRSPLALRVTLTPTGIVEAQNRLPAHRWCWKSASVSSHPSCAVGRTRHWPRQSALPLRPSAPQMPYAERAVCLPHRGLGGSGSLASDHLNPSSSWYFRPITSPYIDGGERRVFDTCQIVRKRMSNGQRSRDSCNQPTRRQSRPRPPAATAVGIAMTATMATVSALAQPPTATYSRKSDLSWASATPEKRTVSRNDLANASANNDPGRPWMRVESAASKRSVARPRCR